MADAIAFALAFYGAGYIASGVIGLASFSSILSIDRAPVYSGAWWAHQLLARVGVATLAIWIVTGGFVEASEPVRLVAYLAGFGAFFFVPPLIEQAARARKSG